MKNLRNMVEDCPACILAAIRQARGLNYDKAIGRDGFSVPGSYLDFDFKKEVEVFWKEENSSREMPSYDPSYY